MAIGRDELHLAENPAVELPRSLGDTYVPPEGLDPELLNVRASRNPSSSTASAHPSTA